MPFNPPLHAQKAKLILTNPDGSQDIIDLPNVRPSYRRDNYDAYSFSNASGGYRTEITLVVDGPFTITSKPPRCTECGKRKHKKEEAK